MRVSELWLVCVHLFTAVSLGSVHIYVSDFILKLSLYFAGMTTYNVSMHIIGMFHVFSDACTEYTDIKR